MKHAFYFFTKIVLNTAFSVCAVAFNKEKRLLGAFLASFLSLINVPAFLFSISSRMHRIPAKDHIRIFVPVLLGEVVLHTIFYIVIRSSLVYPHTFSNIFLDLLVILSLRAGKDTRPPFQLGRTRVPVVVGDRVVLRRMEIVHVLKADDGELLVKSLKGEKYTVDRNLIEEENELII